MLSRSEFDVMLALKKTPAASQRAIASECGEMSSAMGRAASAYRGSSRAGFFERRKAKTSFLNVIMVDSSRMAPMNA